MTQTNVFVVIAVAVALCVVGAIAAVVSGGSVSQSGYLAARWEEPRISELAGGFDPLPEFETTSRELAFRGAECRIAIEDPNVLYRECPSNTEQQ
jgi:threonine dehydrogenase-like Zn-dependent dehydrogenase